MPVDWGIITGAPNPGVAFSNAFDNSLQRNQQNALMQQQMQEHQQDRALKMQQMQQAQAQQQVEAHRENIIKGAQIIRQMQPRDDASWQQALAVAQQAGIDISQVPQHFDPQYVQGISAIADTFAPPSAPAQPNIAKEVDYYRSIGREDLAKQLLINHANPMQAIHNEDGTITLVRPPLQGNNSAPPPVLTDEQMRQMMNGGQSGSAPAGGF